MSAVKPCVPLMLFANKVLFTLFDVSISAGNKIEVLFKAFSFV